MPDLTDNEYEVMSEYWTVNEPGLSGDGKSGFFARRGGNVVFVDDLCARWLRVKAAARNTTPEAIIGELVRREILAAGRGVQAGAS